MSNDGKYGELVDCFGEEIRQYTVLEHEPKHGEGTAILDPHIGGYSESSIDVFSDLAREAGEAVYELFQGIHKYEVEGAEDLDTEEAVKRILEKELTDDSTGS